MGANETVLSWAPPWAGLVILLFSCFLSNCKKDQGLEWIKRSTISHIDLYLVPNKFNILENDWINIRYHSHFDKQDLIRHLRSYGRTLEDLKNIPELQYLEMGNTIRLNVAKSAHSTSYEYDTSIPIIFMDRIGLKKVNTLT
ncbi:MAG: hypothetical protein IPG24_18570 [Leptospiraceae bacterium]|nr:hypothetical protein [Leptospiraceae bacterium]